MLSFWRRQTQRQTGSGLAVQAARDSVINVNGVSASEARDIALDVFRANLLEFRGVAQNTAMQRGEAITDKFIEKLQRENPEGLRQAETPDFQDALFTVQKEYAKAGDEDLGELLVDLLVDRTKQDARTILQIVLNESLHTAPKLTSGQIATLSLIFFMKNVRNTGVASIQALAAYYKNHVESIVSDIATNDSTFQHLQFSGCGTVSLGAIGFGDILSRVYPGLFKVGFEAPRLEQAQLSQNMRGLLIMPCLNDSARMQVAALNDVILTEKMNAAKASAEERQRTQALFTEGTMSTQQIQEMFLVAAPFMRDAADKWAATKLCNFELTSVGMAIGHANIKRTVGEFAPLSIWIN